MQKRNLKKCNSKICKKLIAVFTLLLLCAGLFAHGGMLSGEKKLRVVKTKWFDIIYPERCEASAAILYEKADQVYDEVTAQYGLTPAFRMPVVITPAVDQFNAFWTAVPYNHIAIYDTGSSGASELAVFSETLLSTFRHELTHAVTFNMKNGFWRFMGAVFGDEVAPGMLSVTSGMAEGATVTSESANGEGRYNDEYAMHPVKQAKIEGKFPAYHDVSGASDVSPYGAAYYFNGAFHGWLQEQYGMEAYAEFWYRVVNGKNFTIAGAFKKAFGVKLRRAWKLFEEEYEVPAVEANPVSAGLAEDFFITDGTDYSSLNNAGSLYSSLSAAGEKLIWLDSLGSRVFYVDKEIAADNFDELTGLAGIKPKKLFSMRGLQDVSLSNDGRFIAASYLTDNPATIRARVKIYDLERKSFYSVKDKGLKDAAILSAADGYYLIAQKYLAQTYSISVYKIKLSKDGRITGLEPYSEVKLGEEELPYEFTPLDDGTFAWLKKEHLNYSLCISGPDGALIREYAFPAGMPVRSLSYFDGDFYFSYAQKGTLPRPGMLDLVTEQLTLSDSDISGGVFEPVFWNEKLVYIGEFYRQNRILCLNDAGLPAGEAIELENLAENTESDEMSDGEDDLLATQSEEAEKISLPSKAYNPFSYLYRGMVIPMGRYSPDYIGPNASAEQTAYLIGLTYITGKPWTSGSADLYQLTAGYSLDTDAVGVAFAATKGLDTGLLQTQTEIKSEFDANGWKQGGGSFVISSSLGIGTNSKITLANSSTALAGYKDEYFYSVQDVVSLTFSNARRAGPGRFENLGFALTASYGGRKDANFTGDAEPYVDMSVLAGAAAFYIPRIVPIESKYGYTYNFPATLQFSLFPTTSIYGYTSFGYGENNDADETERKYKAGVGRVLFDTKAEIVLFSMDIQKAIPGVTIFYLNDFNVSGGYAATGTAGSVNYDGFQTAKIGEYFKALADGSGYYLDSVYVKAALDFTPNLGRFANQAFKMSIYTVYSYTLHSANKLKEEERLKLSLGFDLNF